MTYSYFIGLTGLDVIGCNLNLDKMSILALIVIFNSTTYAIRINTIANFYVNQLVFTYGIWGDDMVVSNRIVSKLKSGFFTS